jgi:hypothetical protein
MEPMSFAGIKIQNISTFDYKESFRSLDDSRKQ